MYHACIRIKRIHCSLVCEYLFGNQCSYIRFHHRLKKLNSELDKIPRTDDRYLKLLTEEHSVIKDEQLLSSEVSLCIPQQVTIGCRTSSEFNSKIFLCCINQIIPIE